MRKISIYGLLLGLWLLLFAAPVYAGSEAQGGGGLHFGPYTLSSGDSASGSLTVFGPVTIEEDATFDGDLTVFGEASIAEGAQVDGTLVVMGSVNVAGTVEGDLLSAGEIELTETAYVGGDVSAVGHIRQDEGATVDGDVVQVDELGFDWDFPIDVNIPEPVAIDPVRVRRAPFFVRVLGVSVESVVISGVLGLLALIIVSIWPQHAERVAAVIEDAPLTAFGVGLLGLLLCSIAIALSIVTCILSVLGVVGSIVVVIGVLLGWVAIGIILGKRLMVNVFAKPEPSIVASAVAGTTLITFVLKFTQLFKPFQALFVMFLIPLAAGAVVLTRFGVQSYASQGQSVLRTSRPASATPGDQPIVVTGSLPDDASVDEETPLVSGEPES